MSVFSLLSKHLASMSVAVVSKKFLEAEKTVRLFILWSSFILPVFELLSAVGADKALGMKFVSHSSYYPTLDDVGAYVAFVRNPWIIYKIH